MHNPVGHPLSPRANDEASNRVFVPTILTVVAVDKDKSSQNALKWAADNLIASNHTLILLHVRSRSYGEAGSEFSREQLESEATQMLVPYKAFCARKGIQVKEVFIEDNDVTKAILEYINANHIHNIVLGSSTRISLTKKFRNTDLPSSIVKAAPEFCAVYVVAKGKPMTVRSAKGPGAASLKQPLLNLSHLQDPDDSVKTPFARGGRTPFAPYPTPDRKSIDIHKPALWDKQGGTIDIANGRIMKPSSRESLSDDMDFFGGDFQSTDFDDSFELSNTPTESSGGPTTPRTGVNRDMEAEMKRLKLELKQTMDMYSTACKEAINAKRTARELHQWKMEEERKVEEAKQSEEAALAIAEMEKAKCKAALEAAEAAQRLAELEAKKRLSAERKARREAEEKKKALDVLAHNDVRYRKYSIEDIEIATEYFSESLKIGEGGYGPVYGAALDHTPVAIKVLRPDAAQGRRQFQQEVEVLCCMRHPNMVLLLGACPEYGCLVYEYMDNGSLEDRLFQRGNTPPIPWSVRFKIAAEIGTALLFLHQAKPEPLVHRDLKPANILLDRNYTSKISDVGLSRLVPPSVANTVTQYRMTSTAGTFCYIDPEYQQTGMLGIKSDIYSLGVLLLQIITAKPPMGLTHHIERAIQAGKFEEWLDPAVTDWPVEEALGFAKIALKCAEMRRRDRPDLGTVVLPELNRLRNLGHAYEAGYSIGSHSTCSSFNSDFSNSSNMPPRPRQASDQGSNSTIRCVTRQENIKSESEPSSEVSAGPTTELNEPSLEESAGLTMQQSELSLEVSRPATQQSEPSSEESAGLTMQQTEPSLEVSRLTTQESEPSSEVPILTIEESPKSKQSTSSNSCSSESGHSSDSLPPRPKLIEAQERATCSRLDEGAISTKSFGQPRPRRKQRVIPVCKPSFL